MHQMIVLYIIERIDQLGAHLVNMIGCHLSGVDKFTKRIAVHVVRYDATAKPRNILKIVDHHDIRMRQIVAYIKFLLYQSLEPRVLLKFRLQCLQHEPLAEFLGSVHIIELLAPLGKQFNLGPFFVRSVSLIMHKIKSIVDM